MGKRIGYSRSRRYAKPIPWLPVDSRLFSFLAFSHVRGVARVFLTIEIALSTLMVICALALAVLSLLG